MNAKSALLRSAVPAVLLSVALAWRGSAAASSTIAVPLAEATALAEFEPQSLAPVRIQVDPVSGRVTTVMGRFDAGSLEGEAAARDFLARHAALFGVRRDLAGFRVAHRTQDLGGEVLTFAQDYRGVPVFEGSILVGFDPEGRILAVRNEAAPDLDLATDATLTRAQAIAAAEDALAASFAGYEEGAGLVVVQGDKRHPGFHLAWEIHGYLREPLGDWHIFVDARTGDVVRTLDQLKRSAAPCVPCAPLLDPNCGQIFERNPVDGLDDVTLTDADPLDKGLRGCILNHLTSGTNLNGQWVTTAITGAPRATPPYNYYRSSDQPRLDEVDVYYHIDRAKEYLNTLGFPGVMAFAINADAHDTALGDSSHYVPSTKILEFGTGGVDDAQDPDVIYHEYGHAIQDNQIPGFGTTGETGTLGEGFGDYWAAALTDDSFATVLGPACVASWDATAYNPYIGFPGTGCARRVDEANLFPRDQFFEIHEDAVIWSAALWDLRNALGGPVADPLVIKSHTFLTTTAVFLNAADALILADQALYGGAHAGAIHAAMKSRGIPRTATPASSTGLTNTAAWLCETTHPYADEAYKECRFQQLGAQRMRLHFASFNTESGFDFVYISDADFNQVQRLSGTPFGAGGGFSLAVTGDTIVARFKADLSTTKPGFTIDQVQFAAPPPSPAGRVPDGATAPGIPLRIDRTQFGDLALSWGASCAAGDVDYEIYEGVLGNFSSHMPRTCTTGGATALTIAAGAGDAYYLVVPRNIGNEGSYGKNSGGAERPASLAACVPRDIAPSCP